MNVWDKLREQSGQFWGGFLGALNQGIRHNEELSMRRQQMEQQKKLLDLQIKQHDLRDQMTRQEMAEKAKKAGSIEELATIVGGETTQQPDLAEAEIGAEPRRQQSADPQARMKAAMVRGGFGREALAPQPKSPAEQFMEMLKFEDDSKRILAQRAPQVPQTAPGANSAMSGPGTIAGGSILDPTQPPRTLPGFGATQGQAPAPQAPKLRFNAKGQGIIDTPRSPGTTPRPSPSVVSNVERPTLMSSSPISP